MEKSKSTQIANLFISLIGFFILIAVTVNLIEMSVPIYFIIHSIIATVIMGIKSIYHLIRIVFYNE